MDETIKTGNEDPSSGGVDFLGYLASLAFQAMVFLGAMPSPVMHKEEKNIPQAKLLIDTLVVLRDKTKGNLSDQEQRFLDSSIYELQLKYVEHMQGNEKI